MSDGSGRFTWASPQPGKVMEVPAGSQGEFAFRCTNDADSPVEYEARVEGLPKSWLAPEAATIVLGPFDEREVRYLLTPPDSAELGDYPFNVSILADGAILDPPGSRELFLRVGPGIPKPSKPDPKPKEPTKPREKPAKRVVEAVAAESAPTPPPPPGPEVQLAEPDPPALEPEPVEVAPVPEPTGPEPPPESEPEAPADPEPQTPELEPIEGAAEEEAHTPAPEPEAPPEPELEKTPIVVDLEPPEPEPAPEPPQPEPEPPLPEPEPTPIATPVADAEVSEAPEEQGGWFTEGETIKPAKPSKDVVGQPMPKPVSRPKIVTYESDDDETDQAPAPMADRVVLDPKDGTVISLRPGETGLVCFRFSNIIPSGQRPESRTYVLQEDRALPSDWIRLVQDQVNVTPNGTGELRVLLTPPKSAEPANYPFTLSSGPYGMALTPCGLILNVQAVPSVSLRSKESASTTGPFGRNCDFELTVENSGNADSAYRVSVKDPQVDRDEYGVPTAPDDLHEVPHWRYLFDRELDSLVTPSSAKTRQPNVHRLRLHRRGVWWLGWKESHRVRVAAFPVTDPANGKKTGNAIDVTAKRWRIFPLPWFLMAPLTIAALVLLGSGSGPIIVTNAFDGEGDQKYILGSDKPEATGEMAVLAEWDAPIYAWLSVTKTEDGRSSSIDEASKTTIADKVAVTDYGDKKVVEYSVRPVLLPSGQRATVRFVPQKSDDILRLFAGGVQIQGTPIEQPYAGDSQKVRGLEYLVAVPAGGVTLTFQNITRRTGNAQSVVLWSVRSPLGHRVSDFATAENFTLLRADSAIDPKITPDGSQAEAEWWILTTDRVHRFIKIKLRPSP